MHLHDVCVVVYMICVSGICMTGLRQKSRFVENVCVRTHTHTMPAWDAYPLYVCMNLHAWVVHMWRKCVSALRAGSYSYQVLFRAWFPRGNDRGHLIGEGWKQHLHPIGHTHNIKVLARQKHVKEIYIAAVTALLTRGHSPLALPIMRATFIVRWLRVPQTPPPPESTIKRHNGGGEIFFFVAGVIACSIRCVCIKLPIRIREWAGSRQMIGLAQPLCTDLNNKREISLKAQSAAPIRVWRKWENGRVRLRNNCKLRV